MSETMNMTKGAPKAVLYEELLPQMEHLIQHEPDLIANLANISAVLKDVFGFFWVGFYRVQGMELVLGPFQGSLACTRIRKGRGVCGKAWESEQTILVPDVDQFPGHIACSSFSRSEMVVPVFKDGVVVAVLDVDSDKTNDFDQTDVFFLEKIANLIGQLPNALNPVHFIP